MRTVGSFRVHPVVDAVGPIDTTFAEVFPGASAADRVAAASVDPDAFGPDDAWVLPFRAFVLVGPDDSITMVDLGVGTESSPAGSWAPGRGVLPDGLTDLGIAPADVSLVVLTHLHEDHVGWVVGRAGLPLFGNAPHVVQATEVRAIAEDRLIVEATVDPLRAAGLLREVDGATTLFPGLHLEPTPGHTPGHQSAWLTSGGDTLLLTGDLLVHAVQLLSPSVAYAAEDDPAAARASRERMYAEARRRNALLATSHLTAPFIELP